MRKKTTTALAGGLPLLVLSTVIGCSGPRGGSSLHSLTSQVNSCAATLPLARTTVSGRGRLVVIHPLRRGQADNIVRTVERLTKQARPRPGPTPVATTAPVHPPGPHPPTLSATACVVVYRGPYQRAQVAGVAQEHGRYALLIIRVRHPAVLRGYLLDRLPRGL